MRCVIHYLVVVFTLFLKVGVSQATIPPILPVSGMLADKDGVPLNGTHTLKFTIYNAMAWGEAIWTDSYAVDVENGLFTVYLGDITSLDLSDIAQEKALWLEVMVGGETSMERIEIASMPFAVEAQYCRRVVDAVCNANEFLQGWDPETGAPICTAVSFTSIEDLPPDWSDGDDDTIYSAGMGLNLEGTEFSVDQTLVETWARDVCYDSEAELTHALDDNYVNEGQAAAITNEMLAGEIAPEKIEGSAWTASNQGPDSGLNADMLDGFHASDLSWDGHNHDDVYHAYKRVVIVSPVGGGGNTVANGSALLSAIASINATETNRYLLKVEPGVYEVNDSDGNLRPFQMKPYVDLEGSGPGVTIITGNGTDDLEGTIMGAENSEIRHLTVKSTAHINDEFALAILNAGVASNVRNVNLQVIGGQIGSGIWNRTVASSAPIGKVESAIINTACGFYCFGIYSSGGSSMEIKSIEATVTVDVPGWAAGVRATGSEKLIIDRLVSLAQNTSSGGYAFGLLLQGTISAEISNVKLTATGGGWANGFRQSNENAEGKTTLTNADIKTSGGNTATYGVQCSHNIDSTPQIMIDLYNIKVDSTGSVIHNRPNCTMRVVQGWLSGDPAVNAGSLACAGVYDDDLQLWSSTCE
ncbi:MAG: hypothetical protein QNJ97_17270 [Myxococcota bacterium]|nr:hypothetical protein [Myxococcota bacterium]